MWYLSVVFVNVFLYRKPFLYVGGSGRGVLWHILISVTFCEGVFVCPPLSFPTSFVQIADPESWIA